MQLPAALVPTRFADAPVKTAAGVRYRELGPPDGPVLVFVHGIFVNGLLWRHTAVALAEDHRCIVPDWPLGSHEQPHEGPLDPTELAHLVARFLEELDLTDVTLVGNDTGGAVSQIVAVEHPERLAGLVLTSCDAYDRFPPPLFKPLQWAARVPGGLDMVASSLKLRAFQQSPLAFGWATKRPIPPEIRAAYLTPGWKDRRIRADARRLLQGDAAAHTLRAAERFHAFRKPVLVVWGAQDRFFPRHYGERLAREFPQGRFELIEDARTFIPEDQPGRLADLIAAFAPAKLPV